MKDVSVIWDLEDDADGNFRHIADGHDVTVEEVEEVLLNQLNPTAQSKSSGHMLTFGWTSTGKHIVVAWEMVEDEPLAIYPITAYSVPPRRRRGR